MGAARDRQVVRETLARDRMCRRCWTRKRLRAHHLVALADGGPDALSNTVALCSACHVEWHNTGEGVVPWEQWLETPPSGFIATISASGGAADLTVSQIRQLADVQRRMNFGFIPVSIDGGGFAWTSKPTRQEAAVFEAKFGRHGKLSGSGYA